MWLVQMETCYKYKIYSGFQKCSIKKNAKYIINNCYIDYLFKLVFSYIELNTILLNLFCLFLSTFLNMTIKVIKHDPELKKALRQRIANSLERYLPKLQVTRTVDQKDMGRAPSAGRMFDWIHQYY